MTLRRAAALFAALFAVTFALRLAHAGLLWADEDYHLAAAIQMLAGKFLYRDLWYDKPPLAACIYAAIGAHPGWPLRLFDSLYILAICAALYRFARDLFNPRAAALAAALMAFFLNFDLPSAVIPIAPDFFLLLPAILAMHAAFERRPLLAGVWSGLAFLFQAKGLFVLAACALLAWRSTPVLIAGFAAPNLAVFAVLAAAGALPAYFRQVWQWSSAYAASSSELHPIANAFRRTADWLGFHAALLIAAIAACVAQRRREHAWIFAWLALAFVGAALGARFFPRYFLALLPPLVLVAASLRATPRWPVYLAAAALLIPLARFAPRYFLLARDGPAAFADAALDLDSQAAARLVNQRREPGDTLFVWGYRPAIFVYTRLPAASLFWDSQPLTGVPADRHLRDSRGILPLAARANRQAFASSRPVWLVDSLSLSNPALSIDSYPELRPWLAHYDLAARTPLTLVYRLHLR